MLAIYLSYYYIAYLQRENSYSEKKVFIKQFVGLKNTRYLYAH